MWSGGESDVSVSLVTKRSLQEMVDSHRMVRKENDFSVITTGYNINLN